MSATAAATLAAVVAGLAGAVQATVLGLLGKRIGVMAAAAVGGVLGALLISAVAVAVGRGFGDIAAGFRQPVWLWVLTGIMGAVVVTALTFAPPRIGTFGTFALVIGGQLAASVLIDSLGLFGVDRVSLTVTRVAGLALLAAGAALVLRR
jgi:bacterial/archaeal transporter family-2 protein